MYGKNSVDGVLAGFDKMLKQLCTIIDEQLKEAEVADAKIHEYTVKRAEADYEAKRAERVRESIADLIS